MKNPLTVFKRHPRAVASFFVIVLVGLAACAFAYREYSRRNLVLELEIQSSWMRTWVLRGGEFIVVSDVGDKSALWGRSESRYELLETIPDEVLSADMSRDGNYLVLGLRKSDALQVWDARTRQVMHTLHRGPSTPQGRIQGVCFSANGKYVYAIFDKSEDIQMWSMVDQQSTVLRNLVNNAPDLPGETHALWIQSSAQGPHIITGSTDGYVRFWQYSNGQYEWIGSTRLDSVPRFGVLNADGSKLFVTSRWNIYIFPFPNRDLPDVIGILRSTGYPREFTASMDRYPKFRETPDVFEIGAPVLFDNDSVLAIKIWHNGIVIVDLTSLSVRFIWKDNESAPDDSEFWAPLSADSEGCLILFKERRGENPKLERRCGK